MNDKMKKLDEANENVVERMVTKLDQMDNDTDLTDEQAHELYYRLKHFLEQTFEFLNITDY